MNKIVFIDTEVSISEKKVLDFGAIKDNGTYFHSNNMEDFKKFVSDSRYVCGHNIIHHDLLYTKEVFENSIFIDTLYLSPLIFPKNPYHNLLKDDKILSDEINNPLSDSKKCMDLFYDEVNEFKKLDLSIQIIYTSLLYKYKEFKGFFYYNAIQTENITDKYIKQVYDGYICSQADIDYLMKNNPIELAYALAISRVDDSISITPPWIIKNYPNVENIVKILRNTRCERGCKYCNNRLDAVKSLNEIFGYTNFRKYADEPLQEKAVNAAIDGKSLIAVFPTGGGKSITFQLPALMSGKNTHSLTIIISPLQSLMKDQVDNLEKIGIIEAVTINGMLNQIERSEAINRVMNGLANILYISPEQLRSDTIQHIIMNRSIDRFVIDEAHCFSAWGHDFRVDYLYIGDFIKDIQKKKMLKNPIPVSCFTATAKQKVISDIREYFFEKLGLDLEIYTTQATRENLRYSVIYKETEDEKYILMRDIILSNNAPTIVYVSTTKKTQELSQRLSDDGILARHYHGKMDSKEKIENQDLFKENKIQVMVATSAFGMGVDKNDVKLVIHYEISNSIENYVQEAGRAGRDPHIEAKCYVLFNNTDLDKHFALVNQTRLSMNEISQVWKAIKELTKQRPFIQISYLELATKAGWGEVKDVETRMKIAIGTLEESKYIKRGNNKTKIYATGVMANSTMESSKIIDNLDNYTENEKEDAKRIMQHLISIKFSNRLGNEKPESRVDYLSDILGISKDNVLNAINLLKEQSLLADVRDTSAYMKMTKKKAIRTLEKFKHIKDYILFIMEEEGSIIDIKDIKEIVDDKIVKLATYTNIKEVLYYWAVKKYINKEQNNINGKIHVFPLITKEEINKKDEKLQKICNYLIEELYKDIDLENQEVNHIIEFSIVELYLNYLKTNDDITIKDVEDALFYLYKIGIMDLEGGFLVLYNSVYIRRLELDNKIRYKVQDYKILSDFYKQKIVQIHIVGEYANMMLKSYQKALDFVKDYFNMDFNKFIKKYFKDRENEINMQISSKKYDELFSKLSKRQKDIIMDDESKFIVVAAGPGSGKTKVLVHKLASLILLENIKVEQLLMLTFSRAAATEFKKRLVELIGDVAHYVHIKTFHSYCFDIIERKGDLDKIKNVEKEAISMIMSGDADASNITKSVIVIDEAQDMDEYEFELIQSLINANDDIRIILVGDDDQNIYEFRGSSSKYMTKFITDYGAKKYELIDNYRSKSDIVELCNKFVKTIKNRIKQNDSIAYNKLNARVELIKYKSINFEKAIVRIIASEKYIDNICILTQTNEEALKINSLLIKNGIKSKIIQSNDGFRLYNLVEVRYFLKCLYNNISTHLISDENYNNARKKLKEKYKNSTCLENILNMLSDFENVNKSKYKSDLDDFIKESNYEDFYTKEKNTVFVSTIHKAKGKEFDTVHIMLKNANIKSDEDIRRIYVGISRAKENLFIHYNNDIFDNFGKFKIDYTNYTTIDSIILQLGYKDVDLGFFKDKKNTIFKIVSGCKLNVDGQYLTADIDGNSIRVCKLSKKSKEEVERYLEKGYVLCNGEVRFILAWMSDDMDEEVPIILPNLYMKKRK